MKLRPIQSNFTAERSALRIILAMLQGYGEGELAKEVRMKVEEIIKWEKARI